jgi:hypothetical protein
VIQVFLNIKKIILSLSKRKGSLRMSWEGKKQASSKALSLQGPCGNPNGRKASPNLPSWSPLGTLRGDRNFKTQSSKQYFFKVPAETQKKIKYCDSGIFKH